MPYVSWGTRKALGRRYSVDPAIELERQRLEQEYALQPGREARGIQVSQFGQELGFRKSEAELNRSTAEKSGMIQTGMGAITNAAMIRALTMGKGQPFFGNWGAAAPVTAPTAGMGTAGTGLTYTGGATMVPETTGFATTPALQTVSPAMTDVAVTGMAPAAAGAGSSMASYATPVAYIGAALAAKSLWGGKDIPWDEKTYVQKSTTAPGAFLGAGGFLTNLAGKDTTVGKIGKELARVEQTVLKPIEAIIDWIGGWF